MNPSAFALGSFVFAFGIGLAASGCIESPLGSQAYFQATATDNKTYDGTGPKNNDFSDAVRASGAHDIPCPITQVTGRWDKEHDWIAEGCGERVHYNAKHTFAVPWRMVVTSREKMAGAPAPVALGSAPAPAAPMSKSVAAPAPLSPSATSAASGCSKDTDCKGERICVSSACVDPPAKPVQP